MYLSGGCFWCIADYLLSYPGIEEITVGYSGGDKKETTYEEVKKQISGHREALEILYDVNVIKEEEIIDIYLSYVDPFDKEGQYIDKGFSYTLALYYQNEEERMLFEKKLEAFRKEADKEIYIAIEPFKFFIKAEEYHQHYSNKNPDAFYEELVSSNRTCHLTKYRKK